MGEDKIVATDTDTGFQFTVLESDPNADGLQLTTADGEKTLFLFSDENFGKDGDGELYRNSWINQITAEDQAVTRVNYALLAGAGAVAALGTMAYAGIIAPQKGEKLDYALKHKTILLSLLCILIGAVFAFCVILSGSSKQILHILPWIFVGLG